MLALIQRLTAIGLAGAVAAWAVYCIWVGEYVWAPFGLALEVAGYTAVLALEFLLLLRSSGRDPLLRPGVRELTAAWLKEVVSAPMVFLWQQPFRAAATADSLAPTSRGKRGVILVHGIVCNRGFWNSWMKRLLAADVPYVALTLEPLFGSIDLYVRPIDVAIRRLESVTGMAPVLVAHSMGGLALRAWLVRAGHTSRFHHAVTIATPHRGTWMARFARTTNGCEMRLKSPWLEDLARTESPTSYERFTCFWSRCDNIVFPTPGATLPGADNRHLDAAPHVAMASHPAVFDHVMQWVKT